MVNFDLPGSPEDYVHRIGRTGRAGMLGEAISLVSNEETEQLTAIEKLLKITLPVHAAGEFERAPKSSEETRRDRSEKPREGRGRSEGRSEGRGEGRESRERGPESRPRSGPPSRGHSNRPPADPLFSTPYTPSAAATATAESARPQQSSRGPKKQVAALFLPKVPEKQDV